MALDQPAPELHGYLQVLSNRKWSIALITLIVLASGLIYLHGKTPTYESTTQVLVRSVTLSQQSGATAAAVDMNTELEVAQSRAVIVAANRIIRRTGLVPGTISVEVPANTQTFIFHALSPSPRAAQATAAAYGTAYLDLRRQGFLADLQAASKPIQDRIAQLDIELDQTQAALLAAKTPAQQAVIQIRFNDLLSQRNLLENDSHQFILPKDIRAGEILQPAELPHSPVGPNPKKVGALAGLAGLFLGFGVAFIRDRLDPGIRSRIDLQIGAGAPVLALIPRIRRPRGAPRQLVSVAEPNSVAAEAYKNLRTSLFVALSERGMKSVMITSAQPEEGKTVTSANLGVAFAKMGKLTVLVSADLRRPTLHTYFDVPSGQGLTDVLAGKAKLNDALVKAGVENLWLLDSGSGPSDFSLIGSETMRGILDSLQGNADVVLVDAAPVLGVSDATALAPLTDGVLLVVDAQRAKLDMVREARHQLDQVGAKVVGAVLTNFTPRRSRDGYYAYESTMQPTWAVRDAGADAQNSSLPD